MQRITDWAVKSPLQVIMPTPLVAMAARKPVKPVAYR